MLVTHVGRAAVEIGSVVAQHPQLVIARIPIGASRAVTLPIGEQLPPTSASDDGYPPAIARDQRRIFAHVLTKTEINVAGEIESEA